MPSWLGVMGKNTYEIPEIGSSMILDPAGPLPQESNSQRIGRLANKCFVANCPTTWVPKALDGDDDYGFDYQIQIITGGAVTDIFRAQLKGTTLPALNARGEFFSVTLEASTVRYYERVTDPIMLVLCDLSVDENQPKNCPLYYVWIDEDLRRLKEHIPAAQQSITLRVPSANRLDGSTDISEYLKRLRELNRASAALDIVVEEKHPSLLPSERASLISRIPEGFRARSPALLDAMCQDASTIWPEAPVGSLPWHLQEAAARLRSGSDDEAERLLAEAGKNLANATPIEISEFWFLTGRLYTYRLDDTKAREAYLEAANASGNQPKHMVAWAESELRLRYCLDGPNDFSDIIAKLTGTDPSILGIRARLIAAEGRFEEAHKIAGAISGADGWIAQAIIHTMQSESEQALAACESGLAEPRLRDSSKQLFLIIRARARFSLAVGKIEFDGPEAYLPMSGPAGTDPSKLRDAWSDIVAAVESLRASGWPANVEFIADIWAGVASMLGRQRDILPLLAEAAKTQPTLHMLQSALENIAAQCDEWENALAANARLPESETRTLRRVSLLHMAKHDKECVDLLASAEPSLSSSHPLFGFALSLAILSADRIVRPEMARTWEVRLESEPELAFERVLLDFFRVTSQNLLAKDVALARLEEHYIALGRPLQIAIQLFHGLDATDSEQAERCLAIARDLQSKQMLHAESALHLAQAFMTRGKWQELLDLSSDSLLRFDGNERFVALKALALDRLGNSSEALSSLRDLIDRGKSDSLALNTYIHIVARCGFVSEAIDSVERILSTESGKPGQIECLRMLFNLIHISEPGTQRCVDIAWKIGQLVDKSDEAQEGLFLLTMLTATLPADINFDGDKRLEFQQRLEAFTQQFPESKILKRAVFPKDAPPEELLRMLRQLAGVDDEELRWREKINNELGRGAIPIPYAWRPRHVLNNVGDLPTLWEVGKQAKSEQHQYHLTMALSEWQPVSMAAMRGHVPLLDLISLLVVQDLGLWEHLFRFFPKIAIGQASLIELQQLVGPMSGSPFRQKCLELQAILKAHFEKIIQPAADPPNEEDSHLLARWPSEEVKMLAREGRFMIYSDDAFFRLYCDPPSGSPPCICTLDVLSALDQTDVLSPVEVAEKISTLCKWYVGVVVSLRYQIAILPDALASAENVSNGIEVLRGSPLCSAMFNALWNPKKPYMDLQGHGGALLRELCNETRNPIEPIAALMGLWFGKTRLHRNAPQPPLRVLAGLIMQAAYGNPPINAECSRRLWSVFRELVAVEHGDRMDVAKERQAFVLAGQVAAEIDHKRSLQGEASMMVRLISGLIKDTSDSDAFLKGYTQGYTQCKLAQLKKR